MYKNKYLKYKKKYLYLKNMLGGFKIRVYFYEDKTPIPDDYLDSIGFDEGDNISTLKENIKEYLNNKKRLKSHRLEEVISSNLINVADLKVYDISHKLKLDLENLTDNEDLYYTITLPPANNGIPKKMKSGDEIAYVDKKEIKDIKIEGNVEDGEGKITITYNPYEIDAIIEGLKFSPVNLIRKVTSEGIFKNNMLNGNGIRIIEEKKYKITPSSSLGDIIEEIEIRQTGIFENDVLNGKGIVTTINGDLIQGNFIKGKLNGPGIYNYKGFYYSDPTYFKINGIFKDDKLNGEGEESIRILNEKKLKIARKGSFIEGELNGICKEIKFYDPYNSINEIELLNSDSISDTISMIIREGEFSVDMLNGQGKQTFIENGSIKGIEEGEFANGILKNGNVIYTYGESDKIDELPIENFKLKISVVD
jgi:hypothetical protein